MGLLRGVLGMARNRTAIPAGQPLAARHAWTSRLHGYTAHSVHLSPSTASIYAGDGWGSAFAGMRIRQFSLDTGREVASSRVHNGVRCSTLADDETRLIAVLDTKIIEFDARSLTETRRWDRRVPRFGQSVAVDDRHIVLANWMSPRVGIVDRETGSVRHRDAPFMTQVVGGRGKPLLVGGDRQGGISEIDPSTGVVRHILGTEPILHAALTTDLSSLVVLEGLRGKVTSNSSSVGGPTSDVRILPLDDPLGRSSAFTLPVKAGVVVSGRTAIAFAARDSVLWAPGVAPGAAPLRRWSAPPQHSIAAVDPDVGYVITVLPHLVSEGAFVSTKSYADMTMWRLDLGV